VERAVRNWLTPLLAVMVVVLVGFEATPHNAAPGSAANPIPWINTPGTSQVGAIVQAGRGCGATDLSVMAGNSGAFRGMATQELVLTNHGQEACFLPGPPAAVVVLDDGSRIQATESTGPAVAGRIDLAVGQTAQLLLGTSATCPGIGHPQVGSRVELTLSIGDKLSVSNTWVDVECGPPVVVAFSAGPLPPVDVPASSLSAAISVPTSVARGSVLQYFITLRNPSNTHTDLSPCPSYTETLGTSPARVARQTLLLNCLAMPAISAGAQVVFEMRLSVPAEMPSGSTKLAWSLQVPDGPSAGVVIQVI
jgi:Protein of unknown function (DUF4232)